MIAIKNAILGRIREYRLAKAFKIIEAAGLKGHREGNAMWSDLHANFVVNLGGATARDCLALIRLARQRVRERFGVELELEVRLAGAFAPDEHP